MQSQSGVGTRALDLMEEALHLLDEGALPANIGAHLDLAIERLRTHLGLSSDGPEEISYAVG